MPPPEPTVSRWEDPAKVIQAIVKGTTVTIEFLQHAASRMRERGISEADVVAVLDNPDDTGLPADEGRKRDRKNCGPGVALNVVYEELPDRLRIFSAYRSSHRISGRF